MKKIVDFIGRSCKQILFLILGLGIIGVVWVTVGYGIGHGIPWLINNYVPAGAFEYIKSGLGALEGMALLILFPMLIYFVPTISGWNTKHANGILVINLFLGWTIIGWIIALAWACSAPKEEVAKSETKPTSESDLAKSA